MKGKINVNFSWCLKNRKVKTKMLMHLNFWSFKSLFFKFSKDDTCLLFNRYVSIHILAQDSRGDCVKKCSLKVRSR